VRVAAIQPSVTVDDQSNACEAILHRLRWATQEGIDLLLFPEAFLLGHSYDRDIIRSRAREASGGALGRLCQLASMFPATLVVGAFEIASKQVYNSAFVIEAGRIMGRYAKAFPNEPGVQAGTDFPIFLRSDIRYGINICNDANHAEPADQIARQDADLILYPLNNMLAPATAEHWREKSLANLVKRARQTGCWIASSDVTGANGGLVSFGCTAIIAPDGQIIARVPELNDGVVVHDIPKRKSQFISTRV
jgi:predicted amidohydrolase